MNRNDDNLTINTSTDDEASPLLNDSYLSPRLPAKARIALTCVYLSQLLGSFSLTVIQSDLYLTCKDLLLYEKHESIAITLVFGSVTYVSSIVGGVVADVKLGCYPVTFMACCLLMMGQTVAYIIFVLQVLQNAYQDHPIVMRTFHMLGILLIALGQGLWNVALIPLGMRHMYSETADIELRQKRQQVYLRWFCFFYALGALLALMYLGASDTVSTTVRLFGASMPLWATGVMAFITILGKRFYIPDNIPLGQRKLHNLIQAAIRRVRGSGVDDNQILLLRLFGLKLLAFSILSVYMAIYFQADSTYMDQLRYVMNSSSAENVSIHPPLKRNMAFYNPIFAMLAILALALYGRFAQTCLHWYRVCGGIFLGSCSVACAYGLQTCILGFDGLPVEIDEHWMIPQYGFLGISEAFYFVGGFEMCYALSIKGLETLSLGLFLGVGSVFSLLLYAGFVASGHRLFIWLFFALWILAMATLTLFMFVIMRCCETRKILQDEDANIPDDSDDRERRAASWLEDSTDWGSGNANRPLAIWENF